MDKDELFYLAVDLLESLIAIKRYSRNEKEGTDFLENFLKIHLPVINMNRIENNLLIGDTDSFKDKPVLLLNSHIDTVRETNGWFTDPFTPTLDENREKLTGLGSNDAGASLVSLLATYLFYLTNGIESPYHLLFLASAEEEVSGSKGMELMVPLLKESVNLAIVGEPTGMNPIIAEKGLMVLDGIIEGVSGHAARDEGINAIYKAMPVINKLKNLQFPEVSPTLGPVKISVTQIEAGTQHNVVPDRCKIVVDVRTTDICNNAEAFEYISNAVKPDCELTPRSLRLNPSSIPVSNRLVQRFLIMGKEAMGSPTLSDQALMPWPSIKIGPGDSRRSHTANEYIYLSEIRDAIEIYISAIS